MDQFVITKYINNLIQSNSIIGNNNNQSFFDVLYVKKYDIILFSKNNPFSSLIPNEMMFSILILKQVFYVYTTEVIKNGFPRIESPVLQEQSQLEFLDIIKNNHEINNNICLTDKYNNYLFLTLIAFYDLSNKHDTLFYLIFQNNTLLNNMILSNKLYQKKFDFLSKSKKIGILIFHPSLHLWSFDTNTKNILKLQHSKQIGNNYYISLKQLVKHIQNRHVLKQHNKTVTENSIIKEYLVNKTIKWNIDNSLIYLDISVISLYGLLHVFLIDVTDKCKHDLEIEYAATHDFLTELPNRRFLFNGNFPIPNYLLVLDLDNFKNINDTYGHHVGDHILKNFAKQIKVKITNNNKNIAVRTGGDEFIVLLYENNYSNESLFAFITDFFTDNFIFLDAIKIKLEASIGCVPKRFVSSFHDMLRYGDELMYYVKKHGKNAIKILDFKVKYDIDFNHALEIQFLKALDNDEFIPYIQPVVRLKDNEIYAIEILSRWNTKEYGVLLPDQFFQVIHKSNYFYEYDMHIIKKTLSLIHDNMDLFDEIIVSFNLDETTIKKLIIDDFLKILKQYQIKPNKIILEITENVTINDHIQSKIAELKKLGFLIAVDDFGAGNSSLISIQKLNIDILKIADELFSINAKNVSNNKIIIEKVFEMANMLNLKVVAEGIEIATQRDYINNINIPYIQGYFYYKPMPFTQFISQQKNIKSLNKKR